MSQSRRIPAYRHYKPKNLAVVRIDRKDYYLGRYDSPESREKYHRLIAEWLSGKHGQDSQTTSDAGHLETESMSSDVTIGEMLIAYWQFAESYYSKDGEPTKELESMREALLPLRELYASTAASDFGPKSLKAVRQHMVDRGLCRNVVNRRIGRIKRAFKWAVAEEVVPPSVYHGLQAVPGLRFGRTEARETEPVKPVDDKHVDAVFPYVGIHVAAMIKVQRLTGMRPSDVVKMRPCDIDRSGDVWIYEPYDHKNRWRGHRRLIPIGPRAQEVLKPYLARDPKAFLFSPAESEAWRRQNRPAYSGRKRTTKVYPSELRAREAAKLARRNRKSKRPKVHNVIVWQSNSVRVRPGEKGTRRNRALASKPPQAQPGH